jgi:hypothetical protein
VSPAGDENQASRGAALPARAKFHGPLRDTNAQRACSFSETPTHAGIQLRQPPWTWPSTVKLNPGVLGGKHIIMRS